MEGWWAFGVDQRWVWEKACHIVLSLPSWKTVTLCGPGDTIDTSTVLCDFSRTFVGVSYDFWGRHASPSINTGV